MNKRTLIRMLAQMYRIERETSLNMSEEIRKLEKKLADKLCAVVKYEHKEVNDD